MTNNYIYLIHEREFIKTNEPIYKIGKTTRGYDRIKEYPKSSQMKLMLHCPNNLDSTETLLKKELNNRFIRRTDIGSEYFEGDVDDMICYIQNIVHGYKENNNSCINLEVKDATIMPINIDFRYGSNPYNI